MKYILGCEGMLNKVTFDFIRRYYLILKEIPNKKSFIIPKYR